MKTPWVDRAGATASAGCALHCSLMTFAPALLPWLGLGVLLDERVEWTLLGAAVAFAFAAGWLGHRVHNNWLITGGFLVGTLCLVAARAAEMSGFEFGIVLVLLGGTMLVASHLTNFRQSRACAEACA